ncbi:MAG: CarD family transcriptional regulator [Lachnospiraceae bacterium]|nr:CarD family transcriptional regulator [Lachnospiraceae bacterium]
MAELNINDIVIHNRDGVCRITGTTEMNVPDQRLPEKYYVLVPEYAKNTKLYVPVKTASQKIRPLLSEAEIKDLISRIPELDFSWIENEKQRQQSYLQIIAEGNYTELLKIIGALYRNRREKEHKGRKFHSSDERLLHDAQKVIFQEFAFVLHIKPNEVNAYIEDAIKADS